MLIAHLNALRLILAGLPSVQAWLGVVTAIPDVPADDTDAAAAAVFLYREEWPEGLASFIILGRGDELLNWSARGMGAGLGAGATTFSARLTFVQVLTDQQEYGETVAAGFLAAVEAMLRALLGARGNSAYTTFTGLVEAPHGLPLPIDPADVDYYPPRIAAGGTRAYFLTFDLVYQMGVT